jgi:hypothetical protein
MFNFLYNGKIGEMLAPVVPANQLFLAIQHARNSEIPGILATSPVTFDKITESGYAAIHVACRYNNRDALDMILQSGEGSCE